MVSDYHSETVKRGGTMTLKMVDFGQSFATRGKATEIAEQAPRGGSLIVDFDDVVVVSPSFADEFISRLAARSTHVTLERVPQEFEELLERTVERRGLGNQVRIAALA
jgi:hypothetical protein